ncbi:MAG TPA: BTAD domain-containing putative transcriptional regulator [Longimicrobium sp.]|nr:BTAD domain-containing putative transcriptional regulator [Longimicrobium sp.]
MLYLKVLGDPVLQGPDGPVTGRAAYKRRIALLAVLATARGRPVGRERLIALLWPELSADAARHNLSETLYVLRKELGEDVFVSTGDEIALSPAAVGSDVGAFEDALEAGRMEEAAAAYGGPLLDGFYVSDALEFERWVDGERDRLARACAGALERLAAEAEGAGRPLAAVEWWRRLAAHDPYSPRVALRLAQALDAAGERPAALRACTAHAARMREELGIDPDPALAAFMERLRGEARTAPAPAEPSAPGARPSPPPASAAPDPAAAAPGSFTGDPPASTAPEPQPGESGTPARAGARPARRPRRFAAALAGAGALVIAVAAALAPRPAAGGYDPRRIAVLYFEDNSPSDGLEGLDWLGDALTDALITELGRVPALDVVSRNAVRGYRDGRIGYDSLVAKLRVGSVVEGTVQRSGDSVRVTVQLVDTNRQRHLESRTIVRPLEDVFALEQAVGEEVSGFLRRRLGREVRLRQTAAETRSTRALELVLRGERAREQAAELSRRGHPVDDSSAVRLLARADSFFEEARRADARWARPALERGFLALARADLGPDTAEGPHLRAAEGFAKHALDREPRNARALELRGRAASHRAVQANDSTSQSGRLEEAERDLRAAVEADSTLTSGWLALSVVLRLRGRLAESDWAARRALAQDAWLENADTVLYRLFFGSVARADYPRARQECEQGREQFPGDWRFVECGLVLMREDPARRPDAARAWRLVAELDRLYPSARARAEGHSYSPLFRRAVVAAVLARAGRADSARAVLARVRDQTAHDPELRVSLLFDEARVAVLLDDRTKARKLLNDYVKALPCVHPYLTRDRLFRELLPERLPAAC